MLRRTPIPVESLTLLGEIAQAGKVAAGHADTCPLWSNCRPSSDGKTHLMIKGNFLNPGEKVEPGLPAAFPPLPKDAPLNRLGVAKWLLDADNPLTARVAVNRYWAQLFGIGPC